MTDELRVSDEERDRAAAELRDHFAAGRLSDDELSERLEAVYSARTEGELRALKRDLPALPATRAQTRAELAERRARQRRHLVQEVGAALTPFFICVVIWGASGTDDSFWPIWAAIPALIVLIRGGVQLLGGPDDDA